MSRNPQHIGSVFQSKEMKEVFPDLVIGPEPKAPATLSHSFTRIKTRTSQKPPMPLKGEGQIDIKINNALLDWLYTRMKKENITMQAMQYDTNPGGVEMHKTAKAELERLKKLRKALSLFFLLKALYKDGFNKALTRDTAKKLNVSLNTLKTRLKTLSDHKIIYEQHQVIKCYSVQRVIHQLDCDCGDYGVKHNTYKRLIPNLLNFDYVLDVIFEKNHHNLIKQVTTAKIRQNYELAEALTIVCGECGIRTTPDTITRQHVQDAQAIAFANPSVRQGQEWLNLLYHFNVNEHPNYALLSKYYAYNSRGGMAYRKRRWVSLGIADIYHRQFADTSCLIRPATVKKAGHGHYSRQHKATMFHMVDALKLKI